MISSEVCCANCGKAKSEHQVVRQTRMESYAGLGYPGTGGITTVVETLHLCPTSTFQPKPEPLRAKAGIRYTHVKQGYVGIGLVDGTLFVLSKIEPNHWFGADMNSDWQEVTE